MSTMERTQPFLILIHKGNPLHLMGDDTAVVTEDSVNYTQANHYSLSSIWLIKHLTNPNSDDYYGEHYTIEWAE